MRKTLHPPPAGRSTTWPTGAGGIYLPFTNIYFVHLGLNGREIGLLAALQPLMTLTVAPALAGWPTGAAGACAFWRWRWSAWGSR